MTFRTELLAPFLVLAMCTASQVAHGQLVAAQLDSTYEFARASDQPTALDHYVAAPDKSFAWEVVSCRQRAGCRELIVQLTSQSWRQQGEVNRTKWKHWLAIVVPEDCTADTALLFVSGGANDQPQPPRAGDLFVHSAIATRSVVVHLHAVPNQPLSLMGESTQRSEDDLLAASWNRYLATGDATWIAQLPMAKAAVAAMTATQQAIAQQAKSEPAASWPTIEHFVVSGASKRGWTSWLAAAVDRRVVGVAPIVIDLLNIRPSMQHHLASYGNWSKALADYERQGLADRLTDKSIEPLLGIVDPYVYRDRLTMPKCIINASQDEFFLPDSSQFYFDDLPGEKHLSYTPNTGHSLEGSNALDTLVAFHASIVHNLPRPRVAWTGDNSDTERVMTASAKPTSVVLYRAENRSARDFRLPVLGKAFKATKLTPDDDGTYRATIDAPSNGFSASFVRFTFDIGAPRPFRISTPVWVTPDIKPYAKP
jgi:PhoPQ-activated pathogenicity-related protein